MGILSLLQSRNYFSVSAYFYMFLPVYACSIYGFLCIMKNDRKYIHTNDIEKMSDDESNASKGYGGEYSYDHKDIEKEDLTNPLILPGDNYGDMKKSNLSDRPVLSIKSDDGNIKEKLDDSSLHRNNPVKSSCCISLSPSYSYHVDVNPHALREVRLLLIKVFCLALLGYAVLPSVVSVVASRFDDAYLILSLAVTISSIVDPLIRFAAGMEMFRNTDNSFLNLTFVLFIASSASMIGLSGVDKDSVFANTPAIAIFPIVLYIFALGLFNFLNSLIMLKVHAITSSESLQKYRNVNMNDFAEAIDTEMDDQFTSDAFRWIGCTNQVGMTFGSILVTSLLFSGLLVASDVDED